MAHALYCTDEHLDRSFAEEITADVETLFTCMQCGSLMTEPFYITCVLGSLYLAIRCADTALTPPAGEKRAARVED